jgi:hypothetical protein
LHEVLTQHRQSWLGAQVVLTPRSMALGSWQEPISVKWDRTGGPFGFFKVDTQRPNWEGPAGSKPCLFSLPTGY